MSVVIDMVVPPMGEAIDAARLVAWMVQPGQAFEVGSIVVEIETDKSVIEVPAHESGVMHEHLVPVDGLIHADTVIARIEVADAMGRAQPESVQSSEEDGMEEAAPTAAEEAGQCGALPATATATVTGASVKTATPTAPATPDLSASVRQLVTPAARRLAREQNIAVDAIVGTGPQARVTLADIEAAPNQTALASAGRALAKAAGQAGKKSAMVATRHGEVHVCTWQPQVQTRETFVLVHGMFGDLETWAGLAHTLSHAGARVVAMDLPCHGQTQSQVTKMSEIVDTVADVIDAQCAGAVTLIGHSFGAAVAARVMGRSGLVVEHAYLIAPVGLGTEIEQSFLSGMSNASTNEALERELQKLTASGMSPSASFIDQLRLSLANKAADVRQLCETVSRNGVQQLNIKPDLVAPPCPCTILHGRRDAIIPWQHVLNAPAHIALHLFADAGHMPQWEASKLVADIVL